MKRKPHYVRNSAVPSPRASRASPPLCFATSVSPAELCVRKMETFPTILEQRTNGEVCALDPILILMKMVIIRNVSLLSSPQPPFILGGCELGTKPVRLRFNWASGFPVWFCCCFNYSCYCFCWCSKVLQIWSGLPQSPFPWKPCECWCVLLQTVWFLGNAHTAGGRETCIRFYTTTLLFCRDFPSVSRQWLGSCVWRTLKQYDCCNQRRHRWEEEVPVQSLRRHNHMPQQNKGKFQPDHTPYR